MVFTAFQLSGIATTVKNAFELMETLTSNPTLSPILRPIASLDRQLLTKLQTSIRVRYWN